MFELLLSNINKCDPQQCLVIHRKKEFSELHSHSQSIEEQLKMELLFKLHMHIIHSFDFYRLYPNEETQVRNSIISMNNNIENDNKNNNSNNNNNNKDYFYYHDEDEDEDNITKHRISVMIDDAFDIRRRNFKSCHTQERQQLRRRRFISDIQPQNIIVQQEEEEEEVEEDKDEDQKQDINNNKQMLYSFGFRWEYWKKFEDSSQYYVASKYNNLKSELFDNILYQIANFQWQKVENKIAILLKCDKVRELQANGSSLCQKYEILKLTQIEDRHLRTLLFYCAGSDLQYAFSKTFRCCSEYPMIEDVKQANCECAIWSKNLREAVEIFGVASKRNERFYHGIGIELLFSSTIACFAGPTSTSTAMNMAMTFAKNDGIFLTLMRYQFPVRSFDCCWLSEHSQEYERLFIGGYRPLMINNIYLMKTGQVLNLQIVAINILQMIVEPKFNKYTIPDQMEEVVEKLGLMIQTKLENNNNNKNKKKQEYIHLLFSHICNEYQDQIVA